MSVIDVATKDETARRPGEGSRGGTPRSSSRGSALRDAPGRNASGRAGSTRSTSSRTRSESANRALERRRRRLAAQSTTTIIRDEVSAPTRESLAARIRRVPFVVVVIGIIMVALAATLWLTTRSAQDAYLLGAARDQNQRLVDHRDALKKEYESGDSAPELADKATTLGMIPASAVPRIIVGTDGRSRVSGDVVAQQGKPEPSLNAPHSGGAAADTPQQGRTPHAAGEQAATSNQLGAGDNLSGAAATTNVLPQSGAAPIAPSPAPNSATAPAQAVQPQGGAPRSAASESPAPQASTAPGTSPNPLAPGTATPGSNSEVLR